MRRVTLLSPIRSVRPCFLFLLALVRGYDKAASSAVLDRPIAVRERQQATSDEE